MHARKTALRLTTESLARKTGLSPTTIRYFGRGPATPSTITALNNALGFAPGYLIRLLGGQSPDPAGPPESRLASIERKLDELLALEKESHGQQP